MSSSPTTAYGASFYESEGESSKRSSAVLVPELIELVGPRSIVDVGCGLGHFLNRFQEAGVTDVVGVEGDWARQAPLATPLARLRFLDLNAPIDLGRRFDLALCLEVAEHVEPENADRMVDSLTRLASVIAFSGAVPSQGGSHHVNEQWPEYWARKFRIRNFDAFDPLRARFLEDERVSVFYAQNLVLYAERGSAAHERLRATRSLVRGRVPFYIRAQRHPIAARIVNALPSRLRESVYLGYRSRWKRWMPGAMRTYR
ncbi:MAG: class I SAM-dependent methyltransferase [Thermoplasmata archaeon]